MDMPAEWLKRLADLVKAERQRRDLNRLKFCQLVRINRATLRHIEAAKKQPTQATIDKLAKAFGQSPEQLIGLTRADVDPRRRDLGDEDYSIAALFHHAETEAKYAIKLFFSPDYSNKDRRRVALVLERILKRDDILQAIEGYLLGIERERQSKPEDTSIEEKPRIKTKS